MPYVGNGQGNNRSKIDVGLAVHLCDNPSVAAQLAACALAAPLHGFYFQVGSNKANTAYMFAFKHSDPQHNIVFYASDYAEYISEMTETLVIISDKHKAMAVTLQHLFSALKGSLKDVWDAEHNKEVSNLPLTK